MWTRLSLRARFSLPLGIMFVTALLVGAVSLAFFAPTQFKDETAPAARSAKAVADALNGALRMSANPEQTLDAFVKSLGTSEAIQFRRAGVNSPPHPVEVQTPLGQVPRWFVDLLAIPEIGAAFPVLIDGNRIGDIIFSPDLSAEIFEKWVGFVAIACSIIALTLQTGVIAYFTVGGALAPLRDIGEGMSRLRKGDYDHPILPSGPPEVRRSAEVTNELARTLSQLSDDNRKPFRPGTPISPAPRRASCNRQRRCSWPTAACSTGCGRSTSRTWASRRASRRCCRMPVRRRPESN